MKNRTLLTMRLEREYDVVYARQRARDVAAVLGYDRRDQTSIATAVSEIARNAYSYGGGGVVKFRLSSRTEADYLLIQVEDQGPGIEDVAAALRGEKVSGGGLGLGISGSRRLVDIFELHSAPGQGTTVLLGKRLPAGAAVSGPELARLADRLARLGTGDPLQEVQQQNQELLRAFAELRQSHEQLLQMHRELETTNRGVVALHAELEEKAAQLRQALEARSRFFSYISHELRAPLKSILALSRILLDRLDGDLTAEQEKQVRFIRQAGEELLEMINSLLDAAKIEAGKLEVKPASFLVADLFATLQGMFKPMTVNSQVELIIEDPSDMPPLYTDEAKVAQILRNLVGNALKFTQEGRVTVSATWEATSGMVILAVSDTGPGIPAAEQGRIFEDFYQVKGNAGGKARGTGLGLALSRRLAHLLGGDLSVASVPGQGSTFNLRLPPVYTPAMGGQEPATAAAGGTTTATAPPPAVLVIEDDPETMAVYARLLEEGGFHLVPAYSADQARKIFQGPPATAVILDLLLPDGSGLDLLAAIKKDDSPWRQVPVLVATVVAGEQQRAIALGAEDYWVKPVDPELVRSRLREVAHTADVLIVDDDDKSRYLLRKALEPLGGRVLEAADGGTGLELARAVRPGAIVLDLCMPGMDGFEVLARLREDPATKSIPVVICTSMELSAAERRQLLQSAKFLVEKHSATPEAILRQVRQALQKHLEIETQGG